MSILQDLIEDDGDDKPPYITLIDQLFAFIGSDPEKAVSVVIVCCLNYSFPFTHLWCTFFILSKTVFRSRMNRYVMLLDLRGQSLAARIADSLKTLVHIIFPFG